MFNSVSQVYVQLNNSNSIHQNDVIIITLQTVNSHDAVTGILYSWLDLLSDLLSLWAKQFQPQLPYQRADWASSHASKQGFQNKAYE